MVELRLAGLGDLTLTACACDTSSRDVIFALVLGLRKKVEARDRDGVGAWGSDCGSVEFLALRTSPHLNAVTLLLLLMAAAPSSRASAAASAGAEIHLIPRFCP